MCQVNLPSDTLEPFSQALPAYAGNKEVILAYIDPGQS